MLDRVRAFGTPFFAPEGAWSLAGYDGGDDETYGLHVFNEDGSIEVRTESLTRPPWPISLEVLNVQGASVADGRDRDAVSRVIVDKIALSSS